jgi:hypothetical protein
MPNGRRIRSITAKDSGVADERQQDIGLDHRDGSGQPDQYRGPESDGVAACAAVEPDNGAGNHREEETTTNVLPA